MAQHLMTMAIVGAFLAGTALAQSTQPANPARRATTAHNANWNDTPYGMNGFHPNGAAPRGHLVHYLRPGNIQRLKDGDIKWVRLMIDWRYLEPTKGQFRWTDLEQVVTILNKEGIGISCCLYEPPAWALLDKGREGDMFRVKPEDFADFAGAMARQFKGRIAAYELDNERSTGTWPQVAMRSAAVFVPMLKATYAAIKQGDPKAVVVMNGLWEFPMYYLEDMYKLEAKGSFDAVNIHYYLRMSRDPTYKDPFRGDLDLVLKQVDYVTKKYGDTKVPIWFTEYGWPATAESQSFPVGEQLMAQYLKYFLEKCRDSGLVEKVFWYVYYMPDGMALWHEGRNQKLPAFFAHKDFQAAFPTWNALPVKPIAVPPPASQAATIPGAELDGPADWTIPEGVKATFGADAPQSGKGYLHLVCEKPDTNVTGKSFPLEGGKAYELTGYVRMKGGMENRAYAHAMIQLELLGEGDKPLNLIGPMKGEEKDDRSTNYYISDTEGKWYQVHYNIYAPATVRAGRIILHMGHPDAFRGEADFDNVRVEPLNLDAAPVAR